MASDKKVVTLEEHEQRLMVRGLADYRNDAILDGKPTDDIDDRRTAQTETGAVAE